MRAGFSQGESERALAVGVGERGLGQLQYVFLELPKYQAGEHPKHIVDQWAYFFRAAETLWEIPKELSQGPVGKALAGTRAQDLLASDGFEPPLGGIGASLRGSLPARSTTMVKGLT